ncbi:MAG: hypothetical protein KAI24_02500 [Planctomycetes bacterium]|nr:hypothetical protein [Planctomycetota bacterium]
MSHIGGPMVYEFGWQPTDYDKIDRDLSRGLREALTVVAMTATATGCARARGRRGYTAFNAQAM